MNSKIKLLVILLLFVSETSHSQDTSYQYLDTLVSEFVKELQLNNIDAICIYKKYCVGCMHVAENKNDICDHFSTYVPTYILWLYQGKTFITKKDNCFDYSTIEIDSIFLWKIFFTYKNQIKEEKIKPFEYVVYENMNKETYFIMRDHSDHQYFKIIIDEEVIVFNFDEFDFKKEIDGCLNNSSCYL
jgi:hypothetical protein